MAVLWSHRYFADMRDNQSLFFHFLDLMRSGAIIERTYPLNMIPDICDTQIRDRKDLSFMTASDEKLFRASAYRTTTAHRIGWQEMQSRISRRRYLPEPLGTSDCDALNRFVEQINRKSGLHISLICGRNDVFAGHLSGAHDFLLLAGPAGDQNLEEKCGYYGQQIVLTAEAMGLATCWVGGTYDRSACLAYLGKGERLVCVIAVGYSASAAAPHAPHRSTKNLQQLSIAHIEEPEWFLDGLSAVQLAPSAMNRQGVCFEWLEDGVVKGCATDSETFSMVDLGIAKLHFELGAHGGDWEWGSGGLFRRAAQERSCGAVVHREINGTREYLIIRHNGGHWSFPKGHMEKDETEIETAMREILEETGLTTEINTDFRRTVTYSPKNGVIKDVVFFLATVTGGTEHAQEEEIAQLEWQPFEKACSTVTFPTDTQVLENAEEFLRKNA